MIPLLKTELRNLAVIMDGNRRWAKNQGLASIEGHRAGVKALKNLVALCPNYGIQTLTVYAFSTENWRRDSKELDFLFKLLGEVAVKELEQLCAKNVRVRFLGDLEAFAELGILAGLRNLEASTAANTGLNFQIALNYGAIAEIDNAIKRISSELSFEEINNIGEGDFSKFLYSSESPDILIRTGGEKRLSNFLLWQCANSHLSFVDTLWPDFKEKDLKGILEHYGSTETYAN